MPLLPSNALTRVLTFPEFSRRNAPAPRPGQVVTGAFTSVNYVRAGTRLIPVPGAAPRRFKFASEPTVTVTFNRAQSFVETFVFSWPQSDQVSLLGHEQIHYLITAIVARDYFNELLAVTQCDFQTTAAAQADMTAVDRRFATPTTQAIHDKYDLDTKSKPVQNVMVQTIWAATVTGSLRFNQPLRAFLRSAGLIS